MTDPVPTDMCRHLVIIGLMGAGKSTVAQAIAADVGWPLRDSDTDIERLTGVKGRVIAGDPQQGVDTLHTLEEAVLLGALAADGPTVIAAAGWVVESTVCRAALHRRARVIWLRASAALLTQRMGDGDHRRSTVPTEVDRLVMRRAPLFEDLADSTIDADQPIDRVVHDVRRAVAGLDGRGAWNMA